jgi:hypothetical protein
MPEDSTGNNLNIGDRVRFRGQVYTIKEFLFDKGIHGTAAIKFVEPQHTEEQADEVSVDLLADGPQ